MSPPSATTPRNVDDNGVGGTGVSTTATTPFFSNPPFDPEGKVIIVTGGGSGIGAALCLAFAGAGAAAVIAADLDGAAADRTRCAWERENEITNNNNNNSVVVAATADASVEADVRRLVDDAERRFGDVDLFAANAGVVAWDDDDPFVDARSWDRAMDVNATQSLHAFRVLIPRWRARQRRGHVLVVASAAGLLTQLGSASYSVSKAAVVALAEHVAVSHEDVVGVCCVCPQAVDTPMTRSPKTTDDNEDSGRSEVGIVGESILTASYVAERCLQGLREGRFLVLPHPEVATYEQRKARDRDRWIRGMRRLHMRFQQTRLLSRL